MNENERVVVWRAAGGSTISTRRDDAASIVGPELANELERRSQLMAKSGAYASPALVVRSEGGLPVSPITGRPSSLTAMCRASVGINSQEPAPAPVQQARHQSAPVVPAYPRPGALPGELTASRGYSAAQVARASVGLPPAGAPAPQQRPQERKANLEADVARAVAEAVAPIIQQLARAVDNHVALQQRSAAVHRQQQPTGPHVMKSALGGTVFKDPTVHAQQPARRSANPTYGVAGGPVVKVTTFGGRRLDAQSYRAQVSAWLASGLQPGQVLSPNPPLRAARGKGGMTAAEAARLHPYGR